MKSKSKTSAKDAPRESPRARVMRWLKESIESGEFPCGSEIPSARAVASLLGVAPNTVVTALDEAVASGLVTCRAGTRKRYAGEARKVGGDSLASSTVYVLARLDWYDNIDTAPGWSDEFLALDVVRQLSRTGRHVSLVNASTLSPEDFDAIFAARPGGMVVTDSVKGDEMSMRALARCREDGIPAVAYGNAPELRDYDRAYSDHRAGSRDLTRWLIAHGCKRIVPFFSATPTKYWERERIAGYEEAMREAGLDPHPVAVFGSPLVGHDWSGEMFRLNVSLALSKFVALKNLEGAFPDAILCQNDAWAGSTIAAIWELNLGQDGGILVAGYDNITRAIAPDVDTSIRPAVTVDKHNERTARDMVELLLARMAGTLPPEPQARIHAHEVVEVEATPH